MQSSYVGLIDTLGLDPVPLYVSDQSDVQEIEDIVREKHYSGAYNNLSKILNAVESFSEKPKEMFDYKTDIKASRLYSRMEEKAVE